MRSAETKSVQTTTHAHTVESFTRTCIKNLYRGLVSLNEHKTKWMRHTDNIIENYTSTEHRITQTKPNEAGKTHLWVNWHLQNTTKNKRNTTELKNGDMVICKLRSVSIISVFEISS